MPEDQMFVTAELVLYGTSALLMLVLCYAAGGWGRERHCQAKCHNVYLQQVQRRDTEELTADPIWTE